MNRLMIVNLSKTSPCGFFPKYGTSVTEPIDLLASGFPILVQSFSRIMKG